MTPIKWFWGFLKKYSLLLFIGLLMTTAISVLSIVNPYISGLIVDDVIRGGALDKLPQLIMILLSSLKAAHRVFFTTCATSSSGGCWWRILLSTTGKRQAT